MELKDPVVFDDPPYERAKKLVDQVKPLCQIQLDAKPVSRTITAIQVVIIMVDNIIPCTWNIATYKRMGTIYVIDDVVTEYWKLVKVELENMKKLFGGVV